MGLISFVYILDYSINDKYIYEGMMFNNKTDDIEDRGKIIDDNEITPYVNLTFDIHLSRFGVYDKWSQKFIEPDEIDSFGFRQFSIKKKVYQLDINLYYQCGEDYNCSSLKEYVENEGYRLGQYFIIYPRYKINHFEDPPVIKGTDTSEDIYLNHGFPLQIYSIKLYHETWDWEVIKYQDQKTLFDTLTNKQTVYIFGEAKNPNTDWDEFEDWKQNIEYDSKKGYYIHLYRITFNQNHEEFLFYKRRKVELLDSLAKIGALFSTVKYFFSVILYFYSTNFNNYQIMYKILNPPKEAIKKIELDKKIISSISLKKDSNKFSDDINDLDSLIEQKLDEKKEIIRNSSINEDIDIIEEEDESHSIVLKKLSFFDFFFNNLYSKCCIRIKRQILIDKTNDILYKYLSADSLLCNQIKFENLFQDYKWNNSLLNDIRNNQMIIDLKNT